MGTSNLSPEARASAALPARLPPPPGRISRPALFLDLDGVLAPLAPTPDDVVPNARRTAALRALGQRLGGRVAIVSGRTIAEIDRIAEAAVGAASGVHGLERRLAGGEVTTAAAADTVKDAVMVMEAFALTRPGVIVEDKAVAAGLHYRGAPHAAEDAKTLTRILAEETGLSLQPGNMVIELKTPGASKGTALKTFMAEAPFAGGLPVMLGDDLTDEFGFEAAAELGGFGVLVGPPRQTAARYGLPDVEAVLAWLETVEDEA